MLGTQQTTHFWEYLTTGLIVGVSIAFVSGYWSLPTSDDVSAVQAWLWSLVQWSLGIAAMLATITVAWYAPQLWKKRRVALANQEAELSIVGQQVERGNLDLAILRADIAAKLAAIENEQLRTRAEIRQMAVHVESLTANKSAVLIDSSQANWPDSVRLLTHPNKTNSTAITATEPRENIINLMLKSQRMLLVAPSGAGKTNLLKHYVSRLGERELIIMDPHSPNRVLGRDVIGAGLDFEAIRFTMLSIMHDIARGYEEGDIAQDGDMGDDNCWVVIDEWRDILLNVGELATDFLQQMLIRSRKRGYKLLLINQNSSAESWGIKGDMGLLQTCAKFRIKYNPITDERWAFYGWQKSEEIALTVPGIFEGYPTVEEGQLTSVRRYNDNEEKLLKTLIKLNGSANSMSKAEIIRQAGLASNSRNKKLLNNLLVGLE